MRELAAMTSHAVDFSRPAPPPAEAIVVGRVPRISKMLAFAHLLDAQIRSGVYDDMADAARKLGLTRPRVSQLVALTLLAPAIQDEILSMPPITAGRDPITERTLRPIVAEAVWEQQVTLWRQLQDETR